MNVLIVHAHPEPQSFCSALCQHATDRLRLLGHEVLVSDLYAINFNPVASARDFGTRKNDEYLNYALEQRHNNESGTLATDIQSELAKLLWCDLLILNFPVFWCSTPAIMKGWFDRVLVSGMVYGGKRFYDRGGLTGKKAMVTATIGGQAHMFRSGGIHGPIDEMLRPLLQGTLAYAGLTVLPPYIAWHVPYVDQATREGLLHDYLGRLGGIDALEPLIFPCLDDYDDRLRPLPRERQAIRTADPPTAPEASGTRG